MTFAQFIMEIARTLIARIVFTHYVSVTSFNSTSAFKVPGSVT